MQQCEGDPDGKEGGGGGGGGGGGEALSEHVQIWGKEPRNTALTSLTQTMPSHQRKGLVLFQVTFGAC